MRAYINYLKYVLRHKYFVFIECLKLGVPLWIAILHDWDKFMPDEFFPYVHTFYAPDGSKQYKESVEFAHAWMLHQHRNKHHWQYWLWVGVPSHNTAIEMRKSDYLMWDRGELQRVVRRETVGGERLDLYPPVDGDYCAGADPMPDLYRREMLADWRGAGLALGFPDTLGWYSKNRDKMVLHPETREWIEKELGYQKPAVGLPNLGLFY